MLVIDCRDRMAGNICTTSTSDNMLWKIRSWPAYFFVMVRGSRIHRHTFWQTIRRRRRSSSFGHSLNSLHALLVYTAFMPLLSYCPLKYLSRAVNRRRGRKQRKVSSCQVANSRRENLFTQKCLISRSPTAVCPVRHMIQLNVLKRSFTPGEGKAYTHRNGKFPVYF